MEIDRKQLALGCIALIQKKLAKEINTDEYYLALLELHKKHPFEGHNPSLTKEQYQKRGVQPKNFKEVAEIYGWKTQRNKAPRQERLPYKDD